MSVQSLSNFDLSYEIAARDSGFQGTFPSIDFDSLVKEYRARGLSTLQYSPSVSSSETF
jgi:hypothetical protein